MHNPYEIVREFEKVIADYAGSRYAVAVESCTAALFLCCKFHQVGTVSIPSRTFFSVPCQILHAGGRVHFREEEWHGIYQLKPYPIWDSALRFTEGMFTSGQDMCLSFNEKKHLKVGRGGMILTDDEKADRWYRLARFHGRHELPRMEDTPEFPGWKMHMRPEEALRGLSLMDDLPRKNPDIILPYPDLSRFKIYGPSH